MGVDEAGAESKARRLHRLPGRLAGHRKSDSAVFDAEAPMISGLAGAVHQIRIANQQIKHTGSRSFLFSVGLVLL